MKWIEARVFFQSSSRILATEIIANAFADVGIKGVAVEGSGETSSEGWATDIPALHQPDAVIGYIPKNDTSARICRELERRLSLTTTHDITTRTVYKDLDEEDWAESWKDFFWPQKISNRIVIKPTWRTYTAKPGDIVILLDPGMAFGTGTHATTSLCVRLIETYLKKGHTLLDIGTGSGILLLAAAKLGAAEALGIDNDGVAVTVANENIERNGIDRALFRAAGGDLAGGLSRRFDVVVANILSEVILVLLDHVTDVLRPGGLFICSGIIEDNRQAVVDKMIRMGFKIVSQTSEDGWVAIVGKYAGE